MLPWSYETIEDIIILNTNDKKNTAITFAYQY